MNVILDGRYMTTRDNAHDHLARQLSLPEWYGRNLDALHDLLTADVGAETITLTHAEALEELGAYGRRLLQVLQDAAAQGGPAVEIE